MEEDSTTVFNMKKDYAKFISSACTKKTFQTNRKSELYGTKLNFDLSMNDVSFEKSISDTFSNCSRKANEISLSTKISLLENEMAVLRKQIQEEKVTHEMKMNDLRNELLMENESQSRIRNSLRNEQSKRQLIEDELANIKEKYTISKSYFEDKLTQADRKHKNEHMINAEKEHVSSNELLSLRNENSVLSSEILGLKLQIEEISNSLQLNEKKYNDLNDQVSDKDSFIESVQNTNEEIMRLKKEKEAYEEDAMIVKVMKCKLDKFPELEKENRSLKDENRQHKETRENVLIMKEEISSLKSKVDKAEFKCRELERMKLKFEDSQKKLEKFEVSDTLSVKSLMSLDDMKNKINALQNENLLLICQNGELTSNFKSIQRELEQVLFEKKSWTDEVQSLKENLDKHVFQVKHIQKRLILISRERESIKQVLNSYQSEVTMDIETVTLERIQQLELNIEQHQSHIIELENKLYSMNNKKGSTLTAQPNVSEKVATTSNNTDKELIIQLRSQISSLESRLEESLEKNEIFEARLQRVNIQGDYDPTKFKVVHFQMNPVEIALRKRGVELDNLRDENKRLKERIKLLEGDNVKNITLQVEEKLSQPSVEEQLDVVQKELEISHCKYKRVMEAFQKTSAEFRTLVLELIGYRIDIISSGKYKLSNMYSDSPEDYLLFERNSNGDLNLLSSDFVETITDKIELYLNNGDSFPALLSAVTLELFSKQTIFLSDTTLQ